MIDPRDCGELSIDERRYVNRPLLRLLDCYVLALTGHLDPAMEAKVERIVGAKFGSGLDWKARLRQTVNLPADINERICELWSRQPAGTDPLCFALKVSNENFLPLIDSD